jgi:hypothetical protein
MRVDKLVKTDAICDGVGIGFNALKTILGTRKCVPGGFQENERQDHKQQRAQYSADHLEGYETMGDFLDSIVTENET